MKIGYKIIFGSLLIFAVSKPSHSILDRFKAFRAGQLNETNTLLANFKTRPNEFFKIQNYENNVKSFMEKNITNIELDIASKNDALKNPFTSTSSAFETSTNSAISIASSEKEPMETTAEIEKAKADLLQKQKELEALKEAEKQKEIAKQKEIEKLKEVEKAKRIAKEEELRKQKEKEEAQKKEETKKTDNLTYYVQLGVFSSLENANTLAKKAGSAFIVVKSSVNDNQYVVRSNPGKKETMEDLSTKAKNLGLTPIVRVW